jgi:hypothetical protein
VDAVAARLQAFGRQAQRAFLIQVGAAASFGDNVSRTARTYTNLDLVTREFDRFERRGARALSRRRRELKRDARQAQRTVERQWGEVKADAQGVARQVRQAV